MGKSSIHQAARGSQLLDHEEEDSATLLSAIQIETGRLDLTWPPNKTGRHVPNRCSSGLKTVFSAVRKRARLCRILWSCPGIMQKRGKGNGILKKGTRSTSSSPARANTYIKSSCPVQLPSSLDRCRHVLPSPNWMQTAWTATEGAATRSGCYLLLALLIGSFFF